MFNDAYVWCVSIANDQDFEMLQKLSYYDEVTKNILGFSKEMVMGHLVAIEAQAEFLKTFIPSKAVEALDKGMTVAVKKGL